MVALAAQPPLPTLSAEDKHLLRRYFALGQSVEALASELASLNTQFSALSTSTRPDEFDLAAWTISETIAQHIAYRRAESQRIRQELSLQTLETVLDSESPIERRRAATTILRAYANQLQRRTSAKPQEPLVRPPPQPNLHPSPDLREPAIVNALIDAVLNPADEDAQATAQALFAENATIDDKPAADVPLATLCPHGEIVHESRDEHIHLSPGPPESRTSISFIYTEANDQLTLRITLTRSPAGPHQGCWLISRIDVNQDNDPQFRKNTS